MSAYIVEKNHIIYLIQATVCRSIASHGFSYYWEGKRHELRDGEFDAMAEAGNMLMLENIKSVSARYPNDKTSATLPGPIGQDSLIKARDFGRILFDRFNPVQVIKSCHCLAYQSCEHEAWETSQAFALLEALKNICHHALPGYDGANWGAPEPMGGNVVSLMSLIKK